MNRSFDWAWTEAQVGQTIAIWNSSAGLRLPAGRNYSVKEQQEKERAYDRELRAVEREARKAPRTAAERKKTQDRIVAAFARFSAAALDLDQDAIELLTNDFLPAGTQLARWARRFDTSLSMADIIQACRNAWTACGLQPLLGDRIGLTPSILGYSLLYPYSDNYLDREDLSAESKLRFSERFRERLRGGLPAAQNEREAALWALVELIEGQYSRVDYPQVFDCLLAIHQAQEQSIRQVKSVRECSDGELLRMSCAKGGSSVLADACLAHGWLDEAESRFAFEWGVLLQLGDDLQDVGEDMQRGSVTLFSGAVSRGEVLDQLVVQLLNFSEQVGSRMDELPNGTRMLKELLRMSWRSLILMAVAQSHEFFSTEFLEDAESGSPFRFGFLRERRERLAGRQGLYARLFDALLWRAEDEDAEPLRRTGVDFSQITAPPEIRPA